ncbi:arrestin domain-containing protein 17-like [Branchiostoma lanceolatum]|uniref:ARRDC3 protein n=1 Tax=Branchiostoma lanceolatum TaxID=7740 RepID=A0A8J9YUF6_BRALA|nr:ARRDC3 [Branchiostoma lanceolatum]
MPALNSFYITFEKNMDVYQAGQIVRGQVHLELNEDMKMRGVKLLMKGSARCRWVVSTGKTTVVYTGREVYFENTMTLWGPGQAETGDTPVLPAGQHTYPFQYQLPSAGLPTSFESCYGYVRYFAEAIIDRPWKFDKKTKRAFTVLDMYDLNEDPNALTPSTTQDSKRLGFGPFASDPIEVQIQTDRGAYCPGETVRFSGTLKNGSKTEIKETTVQLRSKATCVATSPHKDRRRQRKTLSEIKALGCKAKDAVDLSGIALPIPAIPPSSQRYCNIIDVEYKIKFVVNIPGLHTDLEVEMPITIGSIPLRSYYPQAPSFPLHPVEQPPPSHESLYPDLGFSQWTYPTATDPSAPPPPYFAVSADGPVGLAEEKDDKYTMGPTEYAPKYAYYDWSKHA